MPHLQFGYYLADIVKLHLHFIVDVILIFENILNILGQLVNPLLKLSRWYYTGLRNHLTHHYKCTYNSYIYLNCSSGF